MYGCGEISGIALAVRAAGTQVKLGEELGVTQQAISQWLEKGWVPMRRALQIEKQFSIPRAQLLDPQLIKLISPAVGQA